MPRKKKRNQYPDSIELVNLSGHDIHQIDHLMDILKDWKSRYADQYNELIVTFEPDYSACYYEGDMPTPAIQLVGIQDQWESDVQYEIRCGYPPDDGLNIK